MEYNLRSPIRLEDICKLRVGDIVYLSGIIVTARDQAHKRIVEDDIEPPISLENLAVFHAGPVVKIEDNRYHIVSIGPTTSMRMEPYEADFIRKTRVKMIIGKGFMGDKTAQACRKYHSVVVMFPGGCGALGSNAVKRVLGVYWIELGIPEALWVLEVENLGPMLVTIDTTGQNMFNDHKSRLRNINEIINETFNSMYKILYSVK